MMEAVQTDSETAPSESEVETLYERLFGTPALDAVGEETEERDEFEAYALVREVAKEYPAVARQAARDGTAVHYRNAHPFRDPVKETGPSS